MIDIFKILKNLSLPQGEYVVVGGAMTAAGIRPTDDLDILVTPNLYQKLKNKGFKQCRCEKCLKVSRLILKKDNVDIVPNYMLGDYIGDTNKLIQEADIINGFPFIKLEELAKFKKELGRSKDLNDIKLIKAYLSGKRK